MFGQDLEQEHKRLVEKALESKTQIETAKKDIEGLQQKIITAEDNIRYVGKKLKAVEVLKKIYESDKVAEEAMTPPTESQVETVPDAVVSESMSDINPER